LQPQIEGFDIEKFKKLNKSDKDRPPASPISIIRYVGINWINKTRKYLNFLG